MAVVHRIVFARQFITLTVIDSSYVLMLILTSVTLRTAHVTYKSLAV